MTVSANDIKKVAKLARIEIEESHIDPLKTQLGGIIDWIDKLEEVNTDQVEIVTNVHDSTLRMVADEVSDGDKSEAVLANAKNSKYGYFAVPKVIE